MTSVGVPSLFRQTRKNTEKQSSTTITESAVRAASLELTPSSRDGMPNNTQIYEGTNQVLRTVMSAAAA